MGKSNNNIEKKLFESNEIDNLIGQKIEQKIQHEIKEAKKPQNKQIITDFAELADEQVFSANCVYVVFNRATKQETFINGVQADGLIGLNNEIRRSLVNRYSDNFTTGDYFVKFRRFKG